MLGANEKQRVAASSKYPYEAKVLNSFHEIQICLIDVPHKKLNDKEIEWYILYLRLNEL